MFFVSGVVYGLGDGLDFFIVLLWFGGFLFDGDGFLFMFCGVLFWWGIFRFWFVLLFCGKFLKFGIWLEVGIWFFVVVVVIFGDCVLLFNLCGMISFIDLLKMGLVCLCEVLGIRCGFCVFFCFFGIVFLMLLKKFGFEFLLNFCCFDFCFKIFFLNFLLNRVMLYLNFGFVLLFIEIFEYVFLFWYNE